MFPFIFLGTLCDVTTPLQGLGTLFTLWCDHTASGAGCICTEVKERAVMHFPLIYFPKYYGCIFRNKIYSPKVQFKTGILSKTSESETEIRLVLRVICVSIDTGLLPHLKQSSV